jgi:hypothetical protein
VAAALCAVAYARGHRRDAARVHVGLEQGLDQLERGARAADPRPVPPVATLGRLAKDLRKTFDF